MFEEAQLTFNNLNSSQVPQKKITLFLKDKLMNIIITNLSRKYIIPNIFSFSFYRQIFIVNC